MVPENRPTKSINSWVDAAYYILKEENRPIGPTELAELILSKGLTRSKSNFPASTVYGCISSEMKKKGSRCRFVKVGDKFGLSELADTYTDGLVQRELHANTPVDFWRRYKFKEITEQKLINSLRQQIQEIRSFLNEDADNETNHDQLCFWVWFCYNMELFEEGSLVFKRINPLKTSPVLYKLIKKIGSTCELRRA